MQISSATTPSRRRCPRRALWVLCVINASVAAAASATRCQRMHRIYSAASLARPRREHAPPLCSSLLDNGDGGSSSSGAIPAAASAVGLTLPPLKPSKIRRGDYVVHTSYGVGLFEGVFEGIMVRSRREKAVLQKYLKVKFRDKTIEVTPDMRGVLKLFKRKEEVDAPLKLDSTRARASWQKRKAKAARDVLLVATDLLEMYAQRQQVERAPCAADAGTRYAEFEAGFPYEPTPDQLVCFEDIRRDMCESTRPMDRLVCGDVGFGKTEAAMRAAYRAVCAGRQVAILAPTTLLAAQHLRTMRARMGDSARVELLSSLVRRTPAQRKELLADVEAGRVDILVGTHAVLSPQLEWGRLGLLIIDEEQRFGVRQKDAIKKSALGVDCLSLSATPIPRTMYMCMAGIRDMTTLRSPPSGRLAVKTAVVEADREITVKAVRAEVARGGQVFYVVPRIEQVRTEVEALTELMPELRIVFAYSKVPDLEQRMHDFTVGDYDVLVSTTIMENGIDIPNVNTIIVQHTQMFGLAQLHQLRGRVGRGNVQAYAYLMHPDQRHLRDDSLQRLEAIQRDSSLGAGLSLAKSDLQMRGAGNLFGTEQKGALGASDVGIDMYMEVLQKAMVYIAERKELGLADEPLDEEGLMRALKLDDEQLMGFSNTLATSPS